MSLSLSPTTGVLSLKAALPTEAASCPAVLKPSTDLATSVAILGRALEVATAAGFSANVDIAAGFAPIVLEIVGNALIAVLVTSVPSPRRIGATASPPI